MATVKKYGPWFLFIMRFISEKKPVSTVKSHREYDTYSYAENAMTKDVSLFLKNCLVLWANSCQMIVSMFTWKLAFYHTYLYHTFFSCYNFLWNRINTDISPCPASSSIIFSNYIFLKHNYTACRSRSFVLAKVWNPIL